MFSYNYIKNNITSFAKYDLKGIVMFQVVLHELYQEKPANLTFPSDTWVNTLPSLQPLHIHRERNSRKNIKFSTKTDKGGLGLINIIDRIQAAQVLEYL